MGTLTTVRLRMVFESGSFTFSRLDLGATNEQLVELAGVFNSLQNRSLERLVRTDVSYIPV